MKHWIVSSELELILAKMNLLFDRCCLERRDEKLRGYHLSLIDIATSRDITEKNRSSLFNILFSEGVAKGYYPYSHLRYYLEEGASMEIALLASIRNPSLFKALVSLYRVGNETLGMVVSESIVKGVAIPLSILRYSVKKGVTLSEKALTTAVSKGDASSARFLLDVFREEYKDIRIHARDLDRVLGKGTLARTVYQEDCECLFSRYGKDTVDMIIKHL